MSCASLSYLESYISLEWKCKYNFYQVCRKKFDKDTYPRLYEVVKLLF